MAAPVSPSTPRPSDLRSTEIALEARCSRDEAFAAQYTTYKERINALIDHVLIVISEEAECRSAEMGKALADRCTLIIETKTSKESPSLTFDKIPETRPLEGGHLMAKLLTLAKLIELAVKTKVLNSMDMSYLPKDLSIVACRFVPISETDLSVVFSIS